MSESKIPPVYRITTLHEDDRPREQLKNLGPQALSSAELIAILLRVSVTGENAAQVGSAYCKNSAESRASTAPRSMT